MSNRRKKQFIDSAVQGALVRRIILHWLIFFTMTVLALPLWRLLSAADFSTPFMKQMLDGWAAAAPTLIILIAMLPLFVWDTVTLSNRFAGPMYRLHKAIRNLATDEEVQPIKLRKGDLWADVADEFNAMLQRLAPKLKQNPTATDD